MVAFGDSVRKAFYIWLPLQIGGPKNSVADPDPHLKSPPRSAWRDADPDQDPGGKKA